MAKTYKFEVYVLVHDEQTLIKAGKARALDHAGDDPNNAGDALRWLLDPGQSPPGCEIITTSVARTA